MKKLQLIGLAVAVALSLAACKKKEEAVAAAPAPAAVEPAPAPVVVAPTASVVSVTLGNALNPDNTVIAATNTFGAKDNIHAVVATNTSDAAATVNGKLAAKWSFHDGQTVNEESKDIAFAGAGNTAFTISKPDGWPLGKYKVEVSLDGAVVNTQEFEVK